MYEVYSLYFYKQETPIVQYTLHGKKAKSQAVMFKCLKHKMNMDIWNTVSIIKVDVGG